MHDSESIPVTAESGTGDMTSSALTSGSTAAPEALIQPTEADEDKKENEVIDVHAPHGGIHTWRDFWIHLGTIALGLLIAIGLEQSVEWVHRIHERHEL